MVQARTKKYQLINFHFSRVIQCSKSCLLLKIRMLGKRIKAKLLFISALYVVYEVHMSKKLSNHFTTTPLVLVARSLLLEEGRFSYYEEYVPPRHQVPQNQHQIGDIEIQQEE